MTLLEVGDKLVALPSAPPKLAPQTRSPLFVTLPSGYTETLTNVDAQKLHEKLGQDLARTMRRRGSANLPVDPDDGGNAAPMQMAA